MATTDRTERRIGLVLGAGGTLGAAWMIGGLGALRERIGVPLRGLDTIVGTSAGSVLAVALRHGYTPEELVAHQLGLGAADLPGPHDFERDSGMLPPPPRLRLGSPRILATAALAPRSVHPRVLASALIPQGRAQHRTLHRYLLSLSAAGPEGPNRWPHRTWIVSVDYESGRRVVFGRDGSLPVPLPDAVVASCSIPGWHMPKAIGDRRYVDGGVRSVASVDVLHREKLDEVYVLAPMASYETDRPIRLDWLAERLLRQVLARQLDREVGKVAGTGARVTVVTPGPADLAAMGANLMDGRRRLAVLETARRTIAAALGTRVRG